MAEYDKVLLRPFTAHSCADLRLVHERYSDSYLSSILTNSNKNLIKMNHITALQQEQRLAVQYFGWAL